MISLETIIIMIVVGVFSLILRKAKPNQAHTGRKPLSSRTGNIQNFMKEITDNPSKDTKQEPLQSNKNKFEKEYQQVRQESEAGRIGMATVRNQAVNKEALKNQEGMEPLITDSPDSRTIINGLIWSEILGEPRSKKPYMVKNR